MTDKDHDRDPPEAFSATPSAIPPEAPKTGNAVAPGQAVVSEGLASHFVRRTDNDFQGIKDQSLIGEDLGDELLDENGDPIELDKYGDPIED